MNRILCPVDFSDFSQDALRHASALAERSGGRLFVLHVETPAPAPPLPGGPGLPAYPAAGVAAATPDPEQRARLEDRLRRLTRDCAADCEAFVRHGTPGDVIPSVADEISADQIVMGTHGRTGLSRLLLGSTAEAVMRKARCPVTVVKREEGDK